jgi:hypothetical protein
MPSPARLSRLVLFTATLFGCDAPDTNVVLNNHYPPSTTSPLVVFAAVWQAVTFSQPLPPGAASDPQSTVSASANTAYVLLAPGWDRNGATTPTSLIALQSRQGFSVHLNQTLRIPVDDTTFAGNCAAGSHLSQGQADFITQRVFASDFASLAYDAATCTTTSQ